MRGCFTVHSQLKNRNKNNISNVGPFNVLQHLHNTCSKRLQYIFDLLLHPRLWAAWAEWPIGFMMIQFSKIIFSPFPQMSVIWKGQFARNHSFLVNRWGRWTSGTGRNLLRLLGKEILHHHYLCLNATWQRNDHCGKMEIQCRFCFL